eukprot:SAG31_NODE_982_length_10556_cov_18.203883_2_plen_142_part_00
MIETIGIAKSLSHDLTLDFWHVLMSNVCESNLTHRRVFYFCVPFTINHIRTQTCSRPGDPCIAHSPSLQALMEIPPKEWLIETFPGHSQADSPNWIVDGVVSYARAWDRIFAHWDAENLDQLFPQAHMMPYWGLYRLIAWS